jgi:hypothetical protein
MGSVADRRKRQSATDSGYQTLFTLHGRHMGSDVPADNLGCYPIESNKSENFKAAMGYKLGRDNAAAEWIELAAAPMMTQPMNYQHIIDSTPTIKANLATMGEVDTNSVEMHVNGVGFVPVNCESKRKVVTYSFTEIL